MGAFFLKLSKDNSHLPSSVSTESAAVCPEQDPDLKPWNPGHNEDNHVEISNGKKFLLSSSATVHSIHITSGGKSSYQPDSKAHSPLGILELPRLT